MASFLFTSPVARSICSRGLDPFTPKCPLLSGVPASRRGRLPDQIPCRCSYENESFPSFSQRFLMDALYHLLKRTNPKYSFSATLLGYALSPSSYCAFCRGPVAPSILTSL